MENYFLSLNEYVLLIYAWIYGFKWFWVFHTTRKMIWVSGVAKKLVAVFIDSHIFNVMTHSAKMLTLGVHGVFPAWKITSIYETLMCLEYACE